MTKEEAIKEFQIYEKYAYGGVKEAIEVAIDAMEKLIKVEKLLEEQTDDIR